MPVAFKELTMKTLLNTKGSYWSIARRRLESFTQTITVMETFVLGETCSSERFSWRELLVLSVKSVASFLPLLGQ